MNPDLRFDGASETVRFEEELHGHPVIIDVGRNTIEDRARAESMSPEELMDFVRRNRRQIVENVRHYLRHASDVTGIRVHDELLAHCD